MAARRHEACHLHAGGDLLACGAPQGGALAPAPRHDLSLGGSLMVNGRRGDAQVLQIRRNLARSYPDVYTPEALAALATLAPLDQTRRALMSDRIQRRAARAR